MQVPLLNSLLLFASLAELSAANLQQPYSQDFSDNQSLLKKTAWAGPWSQRRGVGLGRDPPAGCRIDQVAMLHRHGERYPSKGSAALQERVLKKIDGKRGQLKGSLKFANYWVPFAGLDTPMNEQETVYGPYSGLLGSYANGAQYRARYGHLYDENKVLPIFTAGFERVVMTGRKFGQGFLGLNYTDMAAVQIIPETPQQGANTLNTECYLAVDKLTNCETPSGHFQKHIMWGNGWKYPQFAKAAKRLNKENGLDLDPDEIPVLIAMAAFEINVRGDSPWINVFTDDEWIAFEYLESMLYYCYFGPGATTTPYRGSVYLNATRTLFNEGPNGPAQLPLAFSFAHDTDITPVVSLLGFASPDKFDPSKVTFGSTWDITDIVPQNARLVFERMICDEALEEEDEYVAELAGKYPLAFTPNITSAHAQQGEQTVLSNEDNVYVRVVLNEAVAPIPDCMDGPGFSCKLSEFNDFVDSKIEGYDYAKNCVFSRFYPQYFDMYWNWNHTNEFNYDPEPIPYQAGLVGSDGTPLKW